MIIASFTPSDFLKNVEMCRVVCAPPTRLANVPDKPWAPSALRAFDKIT